MEKLKMFVAAACVTYFEIAIANLDPTSPDNLFGPQLSGLEKNSTFELSAILTSKSRRQAWINGQALTEGDLIGVFKITHISKNYVMLEHADEKQVLHLPDAGMHNINIKSKPTDWK